MAVTVQVGPNAHLRRGVSHVNPVDNLITILAPGPYEADAQCRGATVSEGGATNDWWVRITANGQAGWISATTVMEGADNEPIQGVEWVATVNV